MNCDVDHRRGSDLALLWLWHRLAAIAQIRPLAWEPPYAAGAALKNKKNKTKQKINLNFLQPLEAMLGIQRGGWRKKQT